MALIDDVWLSPAMLPALCELTGTHRTTAMRWYKRRRLPRAIQVLIELAWHGRLERMHGAWRGFTLDTKTGELVTPDGWTIRPAEIRALRLRYQQLAALKTELRHLRRAQPAVTLRPTTAQERIA